jgi:hypothetical protein
LNPVGVKAGANAIATPASLTDEVPRIVRGAVAASGIVIALYTLSLGKISITVQLYVPRLATPLAPLRYASAPITADHQKRRN